MATSIDRKRRFSAAEFLDALETCLAGMKQAELRARLMAHAETLPAAEREAFLAIFEKADEAGKAGGKRRPGRATDAEKLLRDINALVDQCGEERHGGQEDDWEDAGQDDDWDHYEPAHATWPTAKIDALFERADAAFRAGDLALARDAYEKLLDLVAGYGEEGFDEDEEEPEPVGATDLDEVKARYLRALYETTDPAQRPAALLKSLEDLQFVGGPVGIPEVIGARRVPLPDRESFLEAWIDLLRRQPSDQFGFDLEARRLLFQAVRIHRGTEGLAELARRDGRRIPEAYRKWVQALAPPPFPIRQAPELVTWIALQESFDLRRFRKNQRGSRWLGTPVAYAEESGDYFSPFSTIFTLSFRLAWAAASLATGIR